MKNSEGNNYIETYLRILPSESPSEYIALDSLDPCLLIVDVPDADTRYDHFVKNMKQHHEFHFDGIFSMDANQEEVFDRVGCKAIDNFISG